MEAKPMAVERARALIVSAIRCAENEGQAYEGTPEALEWLCARIADLECENATLSGAAAGVDELYAGSFQGEAILMNVIDGKSVRTGERFERLRAELAAPTKARTT